MNVVRSSRVLWAIVSLALLGAAIGQDPEGESAPRGWSPPTPAALDQATEQCHAELLRLNEASAPADDGVRLELERLMALFERQRLMVQDLASQEKAAAPAVADFADGAIDLVQLDGVRDELVTVEERAHSARERLLGTRKVVEDASKAVSDLEREQRKAVEQAPLTPEQTALWDVRRRAARAALEVARLERAVTERDAEQAQRSRDQLAAVVASAVGRVRFTSQALSEQLLAIDRQKQTLEAGLQQAQSNLDYEKGRQTAARRQADDQAQPDVDVLAELEKRTLWRDAYRREVDVLGQSLARLPLAREAWELRYRLANDPETVVVATQQRLREIVTEVDRARSLLDSRLTEVRQQADRFVPKPAGTEGDHPTPERWLIEFRKAAVHATTVLDAERRRLDALALLARHALADATASESGRSVVDRFVDTVVGFADVWHYELFVVEERSITVGKLVVGLVLLLAGFWIARVTSRVVSATIFARLGLNEGATAAAQAVLFYVLLVTIALLALRLINIPLTVFTVLGGALAIGIGFGSQNLMNNFISGLILLAERPIRVGDLIQLGELHGIVQHIGARSTRVLTPNNIDIIVPNSSFLESNVTNWTLTEDRVRTSVIVGVAYGTTTRDVVRLMKKAADDHGKVLEKPTPVVLFTDFGDNALIFELIFWLRMRRMMERRTVESDLRLRINELFNEAGITVAFPQRDVHLNGIGPVEVRMLPGAEQADAQAPES